MPPPETCSVADYGNSFNPIATALALWSAVGRPSGRVEVGTVENWF
jgi:hypothetical protein